MIPRHRPGPRALAARLLLPLAALAALGAALTVAAQEDLLAPWRGVWDRLAPEARERVEANAARWRDMDESEREAFLARLEAWEALPPLERSRQREAYAAWRALDLHDRERIAQAARRYQAATTEQRSAWRAAHDALSPDQARAWLLGPDAGADVLRLRPLFAFVPAGERDRTLAVLRALPAESIDDLEHLVRRMPAARREGFRQELMAQPAAARAAWIREQRGR